MNLKNPLALVATLTAALATHAAAQDFSAFALGSVRGQFGWTVGDAFGNAVNPWNQSIMLDGNGNKVLQISNSHTSGTFSDSIHTPSSTSVAGESTSSLWNDRGTNHTAPINPPLFGANATTNRFSYATTFRSATGAAQPGLRIDMSASAKQSPTRMGLIIVRDNGAGFDLTYTEAGGHSPGVFNFPVATIATGLSYTEAHTVKLEIDFVEGVENVNGVIYGNDIARVYVNGNLAYTGTTWESYYYLNEPTVAGQPRKQAVNCMQYRLTGTAQPAYAGAGFYFSNYDVNNTTAPISAPNSGVVAVNGGSTWDGWSYHGNSKDPGVYAAGSRNADFDVYYTSFRLPAGAAATGANLGNAHADLSTGSFQAGDLIVGVGLKFKNGQRGTTGTWTAKFDRNNTDTWAASTSVAPAAGNGVVSGSNNGGTGYVQFQSVQSATNDNGAVNQWIMRSPSAPTATTNYAPTGSTSGFQTTGNFPFWGQTFASSVDFIRGLPVRTYGVSDGSGVVSYQWLVNSSAFDRAGVSYSAPFQSWANSWSFDLNVAEITNGSVDALGLNLPLLSYSFGSATVTDLPANAAPVDLALADVDTDTDTDFVALSQAFGVPAITVGRNNAGTFAVNNVYFGNSSARAQAIVAGEFDGAAGTDVAVLTSNIPPATTENKVYVFANNGSGEFSLLSTVALNGMVSPNGLAVGNFNGGNADLVVTDAGAGVLTAGFASVLLNSGAGAFTQNDLSGFTAACRGVTVADVNGDTSADIALLEGNASTGNMHVLLGNGSGAFTAMAGSPFATAVNPQRIVASDLDVDGDADLIATCTNDSFGLVNGKAVVFVNDGLGGLARSDFSSARGPVALASGSFEDSVSTLPIGRDVVLANLSSNSISLLGEWRNGAFSQGGIARSGVTPTGLAIGDMNGDGYGDLVYADAAAGSVVVVRANIMARVDSYGLGTAGTGGLTPVMSALGAPALPRIPYATFGLRMSNCRMLSPTVFVLSDGIASPLTQGLPLVANILTSWVELSDVSGNAYIALPIPNNPAFLGAYLYSQGAVFDSNANASFFPGLALSQGLRLRLGN
jgi:hypothetical protein